MHSLPKRMSAQFRGAGRKARRCGIVSPSRSPDAPYYPDKEDQRARASVEATVSPIGKKIDPTQASAESVYRGNFQQLASQKGWPSDFTMGPSKKCDHAVGEKL